MSDFFKESYVILSGIVSFVWNSNYPQLAIAQRLLLLLPVLAVIFAAFATLVALITVIVRQNRREFLFALFVTWWDLGRSIFHFWGGILKFIFVLGGTLFGFARLLLIGILIMLKDIVMSPIRLLSDVSHGYSNPGIPWPAVAMTVGWTALEALIFTYVMTPLVTDVLSGIAGTELGGIKLQIPLYLTFLIFVLGSYAVLFTYGIAVKEKNFGKIIFYTFVEFVVAIVEVVFLYREFVDALVPWFAQHAGEDFRLGIGGTISIAFFVWLGIRAMTWFLFGSTGVPTLLAIIQRTGIDLNSADKGRKEKVRNEERVLFIYMHEAIDHIKADMNWVHKQGDEFLSSFIIPPLQILGASINFCTLIISNTHLFELPFKSYKDILDSRSLLLNAGKSVTNNSK
ncbi:MAG: hypothetical protein HQK54_09125 [Oligoflexales bacterium]|nr:hypothetical protein [Oligoflexales bacterium]